MPTWLTERGNVLLKRHVRQNKNEPLVDEVQLIDANSHYAHIKFKDGRETTVSTRHLAPTCQEQGVPPESPDRSNDSQSNVPVQDIDSDKGTEVLPEPVEMVKSEEPKSKGIPRRSERERKEPDRLYYP